MRRVGLPWWNEISDSHTGQVFIRILTLRYIIISIIIYKIKQIFSLAKPKSRSFSFSRLVHDQQELICTIDFCLVKEDGSR